jgi:diacylglycerol kinase (ATP)
LPPHRVLRTILPLWAAPWHAPLMPGAVPSSAEPLERPLPAPGARVAKPGRPPTVAVLPPAGRLKIGLLSNPRSQGNRRGIDDVHAAAAGRPDVLHERLGEGREIAEVLRGFARREVGLLVVNGGDGTVQKLLTALLEERPFERVPPLAILRRGTANMTAGDVGLQGRAPGALRRLFERAETGDLERHLACRHVLRVENLRGASPQRGMCFGAAGICDVMAWVCDRIHPLGLKGEWAHGSALAFLLLRLLLGKLPDGMLQGHELAVALDGGQGVRSRHLLVLATTLDHLVLGSRPFWNQGDGPIRYTSIAHPPPGLVRRIRQILYGPDRSRLPDGYFSRGASRIELILDGPFTIDGELFEPAADGRLVLTGADRVRFVRV